MHAFTLRHALGAVLCASALTGYAVAQPSGNIPAFQSSGAVRYSCGGIGLDESTAMRAAMKEFPLALLMAGKNGDYLADLRVSIQGSQGDAQTFTATGPVCLLQLPAGRYSVSVAPSSGPAQTRSVNVQADSHTLDFRFE